MKYDYDTLIFEVTRRCNMSCAHCLRGEAQNIDISEEIIDKALKSISYISTLVITGGEPALNVPAIRYITRRLKEKQININSFYIVTNGKVVPDGFLETIAELYTYCMNCNGEEEMCGLALSEDTFHEPIPEKNRTMLSVFKFSRDDKKNESNRLINLGRAKKLDSNQFIKEQPRRYDTEVEVYGQNVVHISEMLVTATGFYVPYCDYEYAETNAIRVGHVDMPMEYLNFLLSKAEDEDELLERLHNEAYAQFLKEQDADLELTGDLVAC